MAQETRRAGTPRSDAPRHPDRALTTRRTAVGVGAVAVVGLGVGLASCLGAPAEPPVAEAADDAATLPARDFAESRLLDQGRTTATGPGRVSFSAWGDVIATDAMLETALAWGDGGAYDFSPLFARTAPWVQNQCDVSLVNMETTIGGDNGFGITGYPSFNTPEAMADAIAGAGFRVVVTDSNHTYDTWTDSIGYAQEVWSGKPGLVTVGSFASEADRETPRVVECNGLRIAFVAYCYGQNGYEQSDLPNDYYAVPWDREAMAQDVERARKAADAVVVYLHMGTEYTNEPNEEQLAAAQAGADAGATLVVGSHAHAIQPVRLLTSADGRPVWCAYGLGDYLSGYTKAMCVLSGAFCCTFELGEGGAVSVRDATWRPVIEHRETAKDGAVTQAAWFVSEYSQELAERNELLANLEPGQRWEWVTSETARVMEGSGVTVV